jgi:hypothetical protein
MHDFAGQLARRPVCVPQSKHSGFDLFFVKKSSLAARKAGQRQSQRQKVEKLAISTLDFARITAHGKRLRSEPHRLRKEPKKRLADARRIFDRLRMDWRKQIPAKHRFCEPCRGSFKLTQGAPKLSPALPPSYRIASSMRPVKPAAAAYIFSGYPRRFRTA